MIRSRLLAAMGPPECPYSGSSYADPFITTVSALGLSAGVKLCVDAGDQLSWTGVGTTWYDRSGGGYNLASGGTYSPYNPAFGAPTHNGDVGGLTCLEHFTGSSASGLTDAGFVGATGWPWADAIGTSTSAFTLAMWIKWSGSQYSRMSNRGDGYIVPGWGWDVSAASRSWWAVGAIQFYAAAGTALALDHWHMLSVSIDRAAGSGFFCVDGAYDQVGGSDTFPATFNTSASGQPFCLSVPANTALAGAAVWQGLRLTKAELDAVYNATKGRFGR